MRTRCAISSGTLGARRLTRRGIPFGRFVDGQAAQVRHQALLAADDEHVAELQSFGGMHGGEPHRVQILVAPVELRQQRHGLRQLDQVGAVFIGTLLEPVDEIGDVAPPVGSLLFMSLLSYR